MIEVSTVRRLVCRMPSSILMLFEVFGKPYCVTPVPRASVRGKGESEGGRVFEGSDTVSELSKAICAIEYKTKDEELPNRWSLEGIFIFVGS